MKHRRAIFTFSFDDGHPNDLKVAHLLKKYGLKATFYVPVHNAENQVMSPAQIRKVHSMGFEIGSHGFSHRRLTQLKDSEAESEIVESKFRLEKTLGKRIEGYCFAGGKYNQSHVAMVIKAGYRYCRSTRLLRQTNLVEGHILHTTMQYYPLGTLGYLKHVLRRPALSAWRLFGSMLQNLKLNSKPNVVANYFMDKAVADGDCFHLHGHSYEFSSPQHWKDLEGLFEVAADKKEAARMDNLHAYRELSL